MLSFLPREVWVINVFTNFFRCSTQLLGQLRASGFVKARGSGDIRDLNTNSENWAVVKAALVAGMHANFVRIDRETNKLCPVKDSLIHTVLHVLFVFDRHYSAFLPSQGR